MEPAGDDTFRGRCLTGATGRLFGGQVLAQALHAVGLYVGADRPPHSLHAYFLRPGSVGQPVVYTVTTMKVGRSLSAGRVDARQGEHVILTAQASFHAPEASPEFQITIPSVPAPDQLSRSDYFPAGTNPLVRAPFDIRYAHAAPISEKVAEPRQDVWFRAVDVLPDLPLLHACALVYAIDLTLTRTVHMALRDLPLPRLGASLDHSMWFHRPLRADGWMLFSQRATTYAGGRSLARGEVFDPAGQLVASAVQEALIRAPRAAVHGGGASVT